MGKLIEFYVPEPRPVLPEQAIEEVADEIEHAAFIKETLEKVLKDVPYIQDVLLLVKNKQDSVAFISTIDGVEANYTFLGRVQRRMLDVYEDGDTITPPQAG